jgi:N utilization substance protein A
MQLQTKQLITAIKSIAEEKNLPEDVVEDVVSQALAAAYRRDYGDKEQQVRAEIHQQNGTVTVYVEKEIVETVENPFIQISLEDAKKVRKDAKLGETVEVTDSPSTFGRVAAQTAKQVILQRLREAEREIILSEYEDKIGSVLTGTVTRVEQRVVRVDLGKASGILPMSEQGRDEHFSYGQRLKVYLKEVERSARGPQLILSRAAPQFIEHLFANEVPEMENGAVEIKAIAREAGIRTKLAVGSTVPGVDPVGTFVGGHGTRVQAVMGEVGESEKIDIIMWDADETTFISNALSPTQVTKVDLDKKQHKAIVRVPEDQLSIAIGKGGQNVRLASKLTGWEIDVISDRVAKAKPAEAETEAQAPKRKRPASKAQLEESLLATLEAQSEEPETKE